VPQSSQKKRWLWAERYFDVEVLTLHFKGQQTFTTSFAFARKQSLVTALVYYKLSLHSIHVKSTLRQWRDTLFTNAKNSVLEYSVYRRLQVKRVTRAQHAIYTKATDRMQPLEACIIEISICFYSGWHDRCYVTVVT